MLIPARTTQVGSVVLRHKADLGSLNADLGQTRDRRPGMIADDSRRAEIARALQEGRKGEKNWDTSTVIRENSALRCFSAPEGKSTLHAARMAPFETSLALRRPHDGGCHGWPSWDSLRLGWPDSSGSWLPPGNGRRSRQSQTPCGASISTRGRTSSAPSCKARRCSSERMATCRPWLSRRASSIFVRKFFAPLPMPPLADKLAAKDYVKARLGERFSPPWRGWARTSAAWLRRSCPPDVLKPNHASSWVLFVNLPGDLSARRDEIERRATSWLTSRYGYDWGEWQYSAFRPRLLLEEFIDFNGDRTPDDYKVYCFHGKACLIEINVDRFRGCGRRSIPRTGSEIRSPTGTRRSVRPAAQSRRHDPRREAVAEEWISPASISIPTASREYDSVRSRWRRVMRARVSRISSSICGSAVNSARVPDTTRRGSSDMPASRATAFRQPAHALEPHAFTLEAVEQWALERASRLAADRLRLTSLWYLDYIRQDVPEDRTRYTVRLAQAENYGTAFGPISALRDADHALVGEDSRVILKDRRFRDDIDRTA